jgi:RND family efflux transporter MFP subunit
MSDTTQPSGMASMDHEDMDMDNTENGSMGDQEGVVRVSPATVQNIGVRTAEVPVEPLRRRIRTTGQFKMDERGMRTVSLKVGGWVETLHADYKGAIVKKGEPLLELYSPELVSTQEEYLLALRNARRMEGSSDAKRLVEATRRRLDHWDLTESQIEEIEARGEPTRTVTFHAPTSGEVMHKNVTEGQRIEPGRALMDIADLSTIWLIADVNQQDLPWIEEGMPVRIRLVSDPGAKQEGQVDHIYNMLDAETRTAKVRITLPGGNRRLRKPGAYATVYLEARPTEATPVVPSEAVVSNGERDVVIQALGDGRFRPRPVMTGLETGGRVQILDGLSGGEQIVTSAQFLIDSEARLEGAMSMMMGDM